MAMLDDVFYDPLSGLPMRGPPRHPRPLPPAALNFDPMQPGPPPGAMIGPQAPFPPAQSMETGGGESPVQGFGDQPSIMAPPLPPPVNVGRPPGMLNQDAGDLPPAAAPASGGPLAAASAPLAAASSSKNVPETSILGRIGDMINNRSGTLLALGAGMAGAQNIGQGMSRGFAAAIPAMQADIKQQQQNETVRALVKRGIPEDAAMAAAANPAIMSQIIGQVFGPKALQHVTVKDRMGNEIPMAFDPSSG